MIKDTFLLRFLSKLVLYYIFYDGGLKIKFVITGPHRCGKTTFIKQLDPKSINIDEETRNKEMTTVAMDIGKVTLNNFQISLFGTPGLDRFTTMRTIIFKGLDVLIFLFDGQTPEHDNDAIDIFKEILNVIDLTNPQFGILFVLNKIDLNNHRKIVDIQNFIKTKLPSEFREKLNLLTPMIDKTTPKILEISCLQNKNLQIAINEALNLAIKKWKKCLPILNTNSSNPNALLSILKINSDQLKELLNDAEMRKLIIMDRKNNQIQITELGKTLF